MPSTNAPYPPQSMYTYLSTPQNVASTSESSKEEMREFKEMLPTIFNEIIVIKHNQVAPLKPTYQNYQGERSSYQQNQFQGGTHTNPQAQTTNQIVPIPTSLQSTNLSLSRELTTRQNNLEDDTNPWCFPCGDPHMPQNCLCDNLQQKVAEQHNQATTSNPGSYVYTSSQMDNVMLIAQMQGMSLEKEANITPDHTLFS